MSSDGGNAQPHLRRDLFIPFALKYQPDDSRLLRRERERINRMIPLAGTERRALGRTVVANGCVGIQLTRRCNESGLRLGWGGDVSPHESLRFTGIATFSESDPSFYHENRTGGGGRSEKNSRHRW